MIWFWVTVMLVVLVIVVVIGSIRVEDDYTRRKRYIAANPGLCEITRIIDDKEFLVTIKPEVPGWVDFDPGVLIQGLQDLTHSYNIDYFIEIMTVSDQKDLENMRARNGYRVFVSQKKSGILLKL